MLDLDLFEKINLKTQAEFKEYEVMGVKFPGMGITYIDFDTIGCPYVLVPDGSVEKQVKSILTSYAMDYYIVGRQCSYYDPNVLQDTLVRTKTYFYNMYSFGVVLEEEGVWRVIR